MVWLCLALRPLPTWPTTTSDVNMPSRCGSILEAVSNWNDDRKLWVTELVLWGCNVIGMAGPSQEVEKVERHQQRTTGFCPSFLRPAGARQRSAGPGCPFCSRSLAALLSEAGAHPWTDSHCLQKQENWQHLHCHRMQSGDANQDHIVFKTKSPLHAEWYDEVCLCSSCAEVRGHCFLLGFSSDRIRFIFTRRARQSWCLEAPLATF